MKVYKKLFAYVPKEKYLGYIALIISLISVAVTVGAYYCISRFLNEVIVYENLAQAKQYGLLITGLLLLGALLYFASGYASHKLGFRLETNLRKKGIDGLTESSFKFFDLHPSGLTRKTIDDNAALTHMMVAHLIPDMPQAMFTPILVIILGFVINLRLGLTILVLVILSGILLSRMMGSKEFMKNYQTALDALSAETVEYVRGMQVIKIFGASITSFKALYRAIVEYSKYAYEYSISMKIPYSVYQWIFFGLIAIVIPPLLLFTDVSLDPAGTVVDLVMLFFLTGVFFVAFMKIMYVSMFSFQATSAVEKLEKMFDEMHVDKLTFGDVESFDNFDIEFDDVSFGYGENSVLEHLSFSLKGGRSYALMGASGSGKTTIAKLISGFYKVNDGAIKIGGKPLNAYTQSAIIKNIAFVFQDAKLFKQSLYDNVALAKKDATRDEVLQAMHLAGCDSILDKFPERENTMIGSKGIYLSGGEKQRIAIARAILKGSNIIILDEASAAVDPESEHELQLAFSNLMKGKTVIMIAHRLTSIKNLDEILVLENGQIIERGSDAELMTGNTKYRELQNLYSSANEWRVGDAKVR